MPHETFHTVRQAAQLLGIDTKTLQKRIKTMGLIPIVPEYDQRLRMLSQEQVETLSQTLRSSALSLRDGDTATTTVERIRTLELRLDKAEETMNSQLEEIRQLKVELQSRMVEWNRTIGTLDHAIRELETEERDSPDVRHKQVEVR